ncbi:MAG: RnfH family protein [Proteobacteria bacterium]|nr:RnfH family protein [Pseudomonadota bacterium]
MSIVEVIYATLNNQESIKVEVQPNDTIASTIKLSGILQKYPEIDLNINKVGIYNQVRKLEEPVKDGDRVEIYRDLIANPKTKRISRAKLQRNKGIFQ